MHEVKTTLLAVALVLVPAPSMDQVSTLLSGTFMKIVLLACRFGRRLAVLCLLSGLLAKAQAQSEADFISGQALDQRTQAPLPYASVGVVGRPVGTVADEQGRFRLFVPGQYDADSLRISLVGYRPVTGLVRTFKRRNCPAKQSCPVPLVAAAQTALREVVVRPQGKAVRKVLGNPRTSAWLSQAFTSNTLGNQIGQAIRIDHSTMLEELSFYVNKCTYDSVFYRVNVYRLGPNGLPDEQRNILPEALYVRLTKAQLADCIRVDLSRYQLWLAPGQHVGVCLELVRDLGPGEIYFSGRMLRGPSLEKDSGFGAGWVKYGAIGAGIAVTVTEIQ